MFYDIFGQGPHIMPKEIKSGKMEKKEVKEAPFINPFRKQFMPTEWAWFRTQGRPKVYTFTARRGEITNLELNVPKQYREFIVSTNGEVYPSGNGQNITIKMEGDTDDYITLGNRETVTLQDSEPNGALVEVNRPEDIPAGARMVPGRLDAYYSTPPNPPTATTFPSLVFRSDGVEYKLDWNLFAQKRKLSRGSFGEDWGYSRIGKPTLGSASSYDKNLKLTWNRTFKWWYLLVAAGIGYGIKKLFFRK